MLPKVVLFGDYGLHSKDIEELAASFEAYHIDASFSTLKRTIQMITDEHIKMQLDRASTADAILFVDIDNYMNLTHRIRLIQGVKSIQSSRRIPVYLLRGNGDIGRNTCDLFKEFGISYEVINDDIQTRLHNYKSRLNNAETISKVIKQTYE